MSGHPSTGVRSPRLLIAPEALARFVSRAKGLEAWTVMPFHLREAAGDRWGAEANRVVSAATKIVRGTRGGCLVIIAEAPDSDRPLLEYAAEHWLARYRTATAFPAHVAARSGLHMGRDSRITVLQRSGSRVLWSALRTALASVFAELPEGVDGEAVQVPEGWRAEELRDFLIERTSG